MSMLQLPKSIDITKLAKRNAIMEGDIDCWQLHRLSSLLLKEGEVNGAVRLAFSEDAMKLPVIQGSVKGLIPLECQRCNQTLEFTFNSDFIFCIAEEFSDYAPRDLIALCQRFDISAMCEDEIILQIPYAPMHPYGTCVSQAQ